MVKDIFKVGIGCDAMENGVFKSFNVAIKEARNKLMIKMLEDIRVFVMETFYMLKRGKGLSWDLAICPTIKKLLKDPKVLRRLVTIYVLLTFCAWKC